MSFAFPVRAPRLFVALAAAGAVASSFAADIKLGAAEALSGPAGQYGLSLIHI